jgi:uncharacterized membrane protein YeaQ/YmgE (transglycosylase-associated protein family)
MSITDIIITALIGLLAGYLAQRIMPGRDLGEGSILVTIIIGVVGAVVGGYLAGLLGLGGLFSGLIGRIALAVIGSILLLWVYRLLTRR